MRSLVTATAVLALLTAGSAFAQGGGAKPPEGPPPAPPRIFQAAGYSQPDITPGLCKTLNDHAVQCTIPEMTVGRYLVQASGTSTPSATDAAQQLTIVVGDSSCGSATFRGTEKIPAKVGAAHPLKFSCITTVMSDQPVVVTVIYADNKATKDPKGPTLSLRKVPWGGVLSAAGFVPQQGQ
jgi:hypothetical protein